MKHYRKYTIKVEDPDRTPMVWWFNFCREHPRKLSSDPLVRDWNAVLWRGYLYFETEEEMTKFLERWS